jgi:inorganic phosphate transporter, PiT family
LVISLVEELGLVALFLLAFANGANDAGKSVASLMVGPAGFVPRRKPLLWGGFFTGIGSVSAIIISSRLFSVFTPQSLLRTTPQSTFILAALAGATLWILGATLLRLPVSSTHAIVGAIVLLGVYLFGFSGIQWDFLLIRVLLPLAAGPIAAMIGIYAFDRLTRRASVPGKENPRMARITHWGSGAAAAYARGVNDAPKMAALGAFFLLANPAEEVWLPYTIVAVAVLLGSLVLGHRVAQTVMGKHVTMDPVQHSKAGAATALVVGAAAFLGAPMSSTQVHEGTNAGIGGERKVVKSVLRGMILPWLVTLPAAGILAIAMSYLGSLL